MNHMLVVLSYNIFIVSRMIEPCTNIFQSEMCKFGHPCTNFMSNPVNHDVLSRVEWRYAHLKQTEMYGFDKDKSFKEQKEPAYIGSDHSTTLANWR